MMATIVNSVRQEVVVASRASAGGAASGSTVSCAGTLATRVGAGEVLAVNGKYIVLQYDETDGPLTRSTSAETATVHTKVSTAAEAITKAIGSESTSRQMLSNAVQQGVEDALLDRVEGVIKDI